MNLFNKRSSCSKKVNSPEKVAAYLIKTFFWVINNKKYGKYTQKGVKKLKDTFSAFLHQFSATPMKNVLKY